MPGLANSWALTTSGLLRIKYECRDATSSSSVFFEPYERVGPASGWGGGLDNFWHGLELKDGFDAGSSPSACGAEGGLGVGVFHKLSQCSELLIWAEGRDYFIISVL